MGSFFRIVAMLAVFFAVIYLHYIRPNANLGQKCGGCSCAMQEPVVTEVSTPVESLTEEAMITEVSESAEALSQEQESQED